MIQSEEKNPGNTQTAQLRRQIRRIGRTFYYVFEPDPATDTSSNPSKVVCQPQVAGASVVSIVQAAVN